MDKNIVLYHGGIMAGIISALILRSAAKLRVSKDEGGHILRDAVLRAAPRDEAELFRTYKG